MIGLMLAIRINFSKDFYCKEWLETDEIRPNRPLEILILNLIKVWYCVWRIRNVLNVWWICSSECLDLCLTPTSLHHLKRIAIQRSIIMSC